MVMRTSPILISFLSFVLACDHQTSKLAAGPKAVVHPQVTTIESNGEKASEVITFRIGNLGDAPFDVVEIKTSCGCTDVKIDSNTIPPGGESILTATIMSIEVGTKHMSIDLVTDIPGDSRIPISITLIGTAKLPYVVRCTDNISFGQVLEPGNKAPIFVETHESVRSEPWVKSLKSVSEKISIQGGLVAETPIDDKIVMRQYQFQATLDSRLALGEFRSEATFILTNATARTPKAIPIHGTVVPVIQSSPSAIFGTFKKIDEVPAFVISFRKSDKGEQPRIETTAVDPSRYIIENVGNDNGVESYRLRILVDFGNELVDELVFRTGVAEMPEIRLPVRLRIRE